MALVMLNSTTKRGNSFLLRVAIGIGVGVLSAFLLTQSFAQGGAKIQQQHLFQRDSITILITDSGLGGLSVCAELEKRLESYRAFRQVRLIFVNALPDASQPYNGMQNKQEQLRVFDDVLTGLNAGFHPDVILIACNTLSVLFPETRFAQSATIPVKSIVEAGARVLAEKVRKNNNSQVIIFGTETTIRSGAYQRLLMAAGVSKDRITVQACHLLESEIQTNPTSDIVSNLIDMYTSEALEKTTNKGMSAYIAGLCCSHYGYSSNMFQQTLKRQLGSDCDLVNPNESMVDSFFESRPIRIWESTAISVEVVSCVRFSPEEVSSISTAVEPVSHKTAVALQGYRFDKNLFSFKTK
ncbi:MAG: aspartate/glutamate racemase family protein [bacterium]